MKINPEAFERRLRAQFVRRAIETDAPLLAGGLHRCAQTEQVRWEDLASLLECSVDDLNHIAAHRPPRADRFWEDTQVIAGTRVDPDRLVQLLRRAQVLEAFARPAAAPDEAADRAMLLAARDYEAQSERESEAIEKSKNEEIETEGRNAAETGRGENGPSEAEDA